jgi:hypothetical protein
LQVFDKWAIDFVGTINPQAIISGERYTITMMEYLTRWVEATPVLYFTSNIVVIFLFENVVTQFGFLHIFLIDQGTHFLNKKIASLTEEFQIHHQKSTCIILKPME